MPRTTTGRVDTPALLLDIYDASTLTGVGVETIRKWFKWGKFPTPVAPGGTMLRWRRKDLLEWVNALQEKPEHRKPKRHRARAAEMLV